MDDNYMELEKSKALHDLLKHITTLSTGSIVFILTFHGNLIPKSSSKFWVIAAIICLFLSVIFALFSMAFNIMFFGGRTLEEIQSTRNIDMKLLYSTWAFFLLGIFSLVIFMINVLI